MPVIRRLGKHNLALKVHVVFQILVDAEVYRIRIVKQCAVRTGFEDRCPHLICPQVVMD